ncbi:type II toxin-antitoxin system VapC family toxin [Compostibacter hankyongensis]|uniref:Ribonuclease VapC n=1 Tax=Compostibacter hankyongensis TaxID=1007089 RepID=A0ABP8FBP9_9BACT
MAQRYLIDTNTVIDYLDNKLPAHAADLIDTGEIALSVITRMELLAWPKATSQQIAVLEDFINVTTVWGLEEPVIIKGIEVRKTYHLKLPDAIIAATALTLNQVLLTRNVSDFKHIAGLSLENPWEM